MKYFILILTLIIVTSLTATNVFAELLVSDRLLVISNSTTPSFEFRDQGSKGFFFQIPDNSKRLEIFDSTSGKTRLAISNAGNIGIGTTTPAALLDLRGVSPTVRIQSSADDSTILLRAEGGNPQMTFTDLGSTSYQLRIDDGTKKFQLLNLSTGPSITIETNGNVGIGTTTPAEKLDVAGNIKLSGNIVSDGDICIGACS